MGVGYELECKSCGKSHAVLLGSGTKFPIVYEELVADIEAGRYGKERMLKRRRAPVTSVASCA